LLVEDETVVRNLVRLMLSREGYAVLTASDGLEALQVCERFGDPIHLLLADIQMPGLNGLELAEKVRKQRPETKILLMSGETTATILQKNAPDAFLRKPFVPPTLLHCVQRVLRSSFHGVCREPGVV
jgi:CheY-like chemotaxis protein